jgi:acyl-CoA-binding protein
MSLEFQSQSEEINGVVECPSEEEIMLLAALRWQAAHGPARRTTILQAAPIF